MATVFVAGNLSFGLDQNHKTIPNLPKHVKGVSLRKKWLDLREKANRYRTISKINDKKSSIPSDFRRFYSSLSQKHRGHFDRLSD